MWCRSGKLQVLEEVLPRWKAQGHKVLLFSQTRQMLHILEKLVQRHHWAYMRMDGATSVGYGPPSTFRLRILELEEVQVFKGASMCALPTLRLIHGVLPKP